LLCNHPNISKMTFTGSVPVGSKVMEACAKVKVIEMVNVQLVLPLSY